MRIRYHLSLLISPAPCALDIEAIFHGSFPSLPFLILLSHRQICSFTGAFLFRQVGGINLIQPGLLAAGQGVQKSGLGFLSADLCCDDHQPLPLSTPPLAGRIENDRLMAIFIKFYRSGRVGLPARELATPAAALNLEERNLFTSRSPRSREGGLLLLATTSSSLPSSGVIIYPRALQLSWERLECAS